MLEKLTRLVETGDLTLQSGYDSGKNQYRYRVEYQDESAGISVILWDDDLLNALERAHNNVSLVANYS